MTLAADGQSTAICVRPTNSKNRPALPCQRSNPDLWFADNPAELQRAKELCGACPVRDICLAAAVDRKEPWGVWGGEIFEQGVIVAVKRPRGRPRKIVATSDDTAVTTAA